MKWMLLFLCLPFFAVEGSGGYSTCPQYLYKLVSLSQWDASRGKEHLELSREDDKFIHFSTEEQWQKTADKYFSGQSFVLLKIDTYRLTGQMVFEANPGGTTKYFHLYNSCIPMCAIVESKVFKK